MKHTLLFLGILAVTSCSGTTTSRFSKMSEAELAAYNQTVPAAEKIYCGERPLGFAQSITKTVCVTQEQARRDNGFTSSFLDKMRTEN